MRTTDKSTDKTNSFTRMGIIMLAAAATGAILGFLFLFILDVDNIKTGISGALTLAQQLILPLLIIITAVSVVCGEASIHKLRAIGKKLLETEDEECDRWAYRSYSQTNRWIPTLLVFAMLGHLLFSTGILAIFMVAVIWLITAVSYLRSCVN